MASFSNLPPELIAHTVSFLQTADTHDVCFGGRTNHLDRLRRRADSLCRDRAALAVVCREWPLTSQRCATSPVSTLDWQMQVCTSLK